MTLSKLLLFFTFCICQSAVAQNDSIHTLETVEIADLQLKDYSSSQSVRQLPDSIISKNQASLTSLLQYNSLIYFKQNGYGMVSSPSFRGTTAQQTAVIWNGISINSQLNGQTDFNTLNTRNFSSVSIRSGGGSAIYGSGAIGGSIHLNTGLDFRSQFKNRLRLDYGSFNTAGANYRLEAGTEKFAVQAAISRNSSDNDYKYLGTVLKNENGQYYNTSINIAAGYKFGTGTILKLYSQLFEGERHLSGTLASPSKSKYQDKNARNMLELASLHGRFMSKLKLAFLSENYSYFEDAEAPFYSYGKAETKIAKYDLVFNINENIQLNSILEYDHIKGSGSDILKSRREVGSGVLLFKHAVSKAFLYEISIRKELADNYKSPVLYSFGTNWRLSGWHALKFNVSKNFRIPTLNDLYWQGNGNASLNPENSWQAEMTQEFSAGNFKFSAAGYYIKIKDLIRWSPESGAVWSPDNVAEVASYGFEGCLNWNKAFRKSKIDFNASYAYTVSNDERLGKQLIYVPYHKMASSVSYSWQKFTAYGSYLFNGKVFTSSDNYYALDRYTVANIGISYALPVASLGFEILNAFDESYQSTLNRPMPGRNFNLNLTFNF